MFRTNESEYESERKISLMFAAYSLIVFSFAPAFALCEQESIPVGCVLSAAVVIGVAISVKLTDYSK